MNKQDDSIMSVNSVWNTILFAHSGTILTEKENNRHVMIIKLQVVPARIALYPPGFV